MHHIRDDIDRVLHRMLEEDRKAKEKLEAERKAWDKRLDAAIARQEEQERQT